MARRAGTIIVDGMGNHFRLTFAKYKEFLKSIVKEDPEHEDEETRIAARERFLETEGTPIPLNEIIRVESLTRDSALDALLSEI